MWVDNHYHIEQGCFTKVYVHPQVDRVIFTMHRTCDAKIKAWNAIGILQHYWEVGELLQGVCTKLYPIKEFYGWAKAWRLYIEHVKWDLGRYDNNCVYPENIDVLEYLGRRNSIARAYVDIMRDLYDTRTLFWDIRRDNWMQRDGQIYPLDIVNFDGEYSNEVYDLRAVKPFEPLPIIRRRVS